MWCAKLQAATFRTFTKATCIPQSDVAMLLRTCMLIACFLRARDEALPLMLRGDIMAEPTPPLHSHVLAREDARARKDAEDTGAGGGQVVSE